MQNIVLVIHLLLALLLIGAVLLQRSEGGALGIGGGGGGSLMSGRGAATALQKATWALAAAFIVTSLVLTFFAIEQARDRGLGLGEQPAPAAEESPINRTGEGIIPNLPSAGGGDDAPAEERPAPTESAPAGENEDRTSPPVNLPPAGGSGG